MSEPNRHELIDLAKLCLKLSRYNDALECMKNVSKMGTALNYEERQLLFNALRKQRTSLIVNLQ